MRYGMERLGITEAQIIQAEHDRALKLAEERECRGSSRVGKAIRRLMSFTWLRMGGIAVCLVMTYITWGYLYRWLDRPPFSEANILKPFFAFVLAILLGTGFYFAPIFVWLGLAWLFLAWDNTVKPDEGP
jgi:hypothetical protein